MKYNKGIALRFEEPVCYTVRSFVDMAPAIGDRGVSSLLCHLYNHVRGPTGDTVIFSNINRPVVISYITEPSDVACCFYGINETESVK